MRRGRKLSHRFGRGLMRSAARLTYTEVQDLTDQGAEQARRVCSPPCMARSEPCLRRGRIAARWTSTCRNVRWCSIRRAA